MLVHMAEAALIGNGGPKKNQVGVPRQVRHELVGKLAVHMFGHFRAHRQIEFLGEVERLFQVVHGEVAFLDQQPGLVGPGAVHTANQACAPVLE